MQESGIVFGLTAVLYGEITMENGRVAQENFDTYPFLRIGETPAVEVFIVPRRRNLALLADAFPLSYRFH
jgi:CO/xanthine dehydrogenase Mo-binding subunit